MNKILLLSVNHNDLRIADSIQNHRLESALAQFMNVKVLKRTKKSEGNKFNIYSPNIYILDRILYKFFPFLISIWCLDKFLWSIVAFLKIRSSLGDYDIVLITYEPYTTRIFQRLVRLYSKCKIGLIIYDPYVDNIFLSQSKMGIWLRKKIEKRIVKSADFVVVNNDRTLSVFKQRYPKSFIDLIPLCGIEHQIQINEEKRNLKKILVHAGNIYGKRRIDDLNNVITFLKNKDANISNKIEIRLYGNVCVGMNKVKISGNDDVIRYYGCLGQEQLKHVINQSDALLLIDPMDKNNFCFPSKLCEYFQYRKPIFGFAGKETPSYMALLESGNCVVDENNTEEMANYLLKWVEDDSEITNRINFCYCDKFMPENIANLYQTIFSKL